LEPSCEGNIAGSAAITYEKQDEVLKKGLRNGVHHYQRYFQAERSIDGLTPQSKEIPSKLWYLQRCRDDDRPIPFGHTKKNRKDPAAIVPKCPNANVCFGLRLQPVDATPAANRSARVSDSRNFSGARLARAPSSLTSACQYPDKSVSLENSVWTGD